MRVYIIVDGASVPDELAGDPGVLLDTEGAAHHRYQADLPNAVSDSPGRLYRVPQPTSRPDRLDRLPDPDIQF